MLLDEALRTQEHPLVVFRDGPAGRRARLIGGPDVWEVARAIVSARSAEPDLTPEELMSLVSDTSGVPTRLVHAAVEYWTAFPEEIDTWIDRVAAETSETEQRWRRAQELLGR